MSDHTSVAPPVPEGGNLCANSNECPALLALKLESTWKSSLPLLPITLSGVNSIKFIEPRSLLTVLRTTVQRH
jgi:hypothetical protein